jgi:hypothetical protein
MFSTFTELNRKRPPLDLIDFVTFCTTPNVHAGDDRSIMETLQSLPFVAASVNAIVGDKPWVVGPSTIGMRDNPYGAAPLPNRDNVRMAMAGRDPRQAALFNAAWTLGYVSRFAVGGVQRIAVSAPVGDFGILGSCGGIFPVFHVVKGCAHLRDATLHTASTSRQQNVLALFAAKTGATELWLANLTAAQVIVTVPETLRHAIGHLLDAESGPGWADLRKLPALAATFALSPYAVAVLRAGA